MTLSISACQTIRSRMAQGQMDLTSLCAASSWGTINGHVIAHSSLLDAVQFLLTTEALSADLPHCKIARGNSPIRSPDRKMQKHWRQGSLGHAGLRPRQGLTRAGAASGQRPLQLAPCCLNDMAMNRTMAPSLSWPIQAIINC